MRQVLCIGGMDPAGRAGLLADARAVQALGARPLCVPTALTFQSSRTVDGYAPVDPDTLRKQLAPLLRDERIDAVKLGQLATAENAQVVAELAPDVPLVLDTPLVSSSGAALFPSDQVRDSYGPLVARATLVTPNALEVFALLQEPSVPDRAACVRAAQRLGARAVLLKGGHLEGGQVVDLLLAGETTHAFASPRIAGRFRGTGCRLAAAIAARLAQGDVLIDAIAAARAWLVSQLEREARGEG